MLVFLLCVFVNLGYSLYDILTVCKDDIKGVKAPTIIAAFATTAVIYYFIFELRLVKLKLEC